MNKMEYLSKLEACLKRRLSKAEINDIMRDYAEYFEEGRRQSKSDSEISAKLGDPEMVARQIIEESVENAASSPINIKEEWKHSKEDIHQWEIGQSAKGCLSSLLKIIGLLILFPIALVAVAGCAVFLFLLLGGLCLLMLLPAAAVVAGLAGLFVSVMAISYSLLSVGIVGIFGSVALIALGVCVTALLVMFIRRLLYLIKKIFVSLKNSLFPASKGTNSKEAAEQEAAEPCSEPCASQQPPVPEDIFNNPTEENSQDGALNETVPLFKEGKDHE